MEEEDARERLLAGLAQFEEEERISEAGRAPVSLDQESVGRLSRRLSAAPVRQTANPGCPTGPASPLARHNQRNAEAP